MNIPDSRCGKMFAEGRFGKAFFSRQRQLAHIQDHADSRFPQACYEAVNIQAFIAERE